MKMTTPQIRHKIYVQEWADQLRQQQASGLGVREWCKQNNIPLSTFSSHNRAVREAAMEESCPQMFDAPRLTENEVPTLNLTQVHLNSNATSSIRSYSNPPDIHLEIHGVSVDINNTADREHMAYVLGLVFNVK